jgi:spermidine synthase
LENSLSSITTLLSTTQMLSSESLSGGMRSLEKQPAAGSIAVLGRTIKKVSSHSPAKPSVSNAFVTALLFCSGVAALVYQVLWVKQLSLIVGIDVYAVTIGVSAFFAGLALGSLLFGRWADRVSNPLLMYVSLEAVTALLGVIVTAALARAPKTFVLLQQQSTVLPWLLLFLLIGLPACLMGGTLPVLIRASSRAKDHLVLVAGYAYASNTAGAVFGTLAAAFFFLPVFGIQRSAWCAAFLNIVIAAAALLLSRSTALPPASKPAQRANPLTHDSRFALYLYTATGAVALGLEVFWSQALVQFLSTRTFAFAVLLASYLLGIVVGSLLYPRLAKHFADGWTLFALLMALVGCLALAGITLLGDWMTTVQSVTELFVLRFTGNELAAMCCRFAVVSVLTVLPTTVCLGAAMPAVLRLIGRINHAGNDSGLAIALNTAGGIAGSVLTGFLFIPRLGLVHTLALLSLSACCVCLAAILRAAQVSRPHQFLLAALCLVTFLLAGFTPSNLFANLLANSHGHAQVLYYRESAGGTVAVLQQQNSSHSTRRLYIQGVSNSGDAMASLRYMRLQALLPLILHNGEPRSALVIGLGTGITAGALLSYPDLKQRVCVELLPAVVEAAPLFQGNLGVSASNISIVQRDGRRELLLHPNRYDVITLEPPPPNASGVVNLYSSDFYRLARTRLQPHGVFAQWWPLATQNEQDSRAIVRSFLDAFPYASLWTTELHEALLVGSNDPIELNIPRIASRFNQQSVSGALSDTGVRSSAALLATWITGRAGLAKFAAAARPVTDDRPSIEYGTWTHRNELLRVLPDVLSLYSAPPLVSAPENFANELEAERKILMEFYRASLYAYQGDQKAWANSMRSVVQQDPANPYYSWILGNDNR